MEINILPLLVAVIFIGRFIHGASESGNIRLDEEDWVDPFDMINYDHSTKSMYSKPMKEAAVRGEHNVELMRQCKHELQACLAERNRSTQVRPPTPQESCTQSELYIRRFVNILLRASRLTEDLPLNLDTTLRVVVTTDQLKILQEFSRGSGDVSVQQLEGVLSSVLLSASINLYSPDSVLLSTLVDFFMSRETLLALALGALPVYITWKVLSGHSLIRVFIIFLTAIFMISFSVTYCRMYKQEEIRQYSILKRNPNAPMECRPPSDLTWLETIQKVMTSQLSYQSDECQKYYEAVMMDPFLKVTPTVVLSEMISSFVLHPSGALGTAIANFSSGILGNLPFGTNYIVLLMSILLLVVLLVVSCGGAIKLPFYLGGAELSGRRSPPERITQREQGGGESLNMLLRAVDSADTGLIIANARGLQILSSGRLEEKTHIPGCCGESSASCQHDMVANVPAPQPSPAKPKKNKTEEVRLRKAIEALNKAQQDEMSSSCTMQRLVVQPPAATHTSVEELPVQPPVTHTSIEELLVQPPATHTSVEELLVQPPATHTSVEKLMVQEVCNTKELPVQTLAIQEVPIEEVTVQQCDTASTKSSSIEACDMSDLEEEASYVRL